MLIPDFEFDTQPEFLEGFALMATNPSLEMVHWNSGAEALLGFSKDAVLGRLPFEVFMTSQDFSVAADYCSQLISAAADEVELWAHYSAHTCTGERVDCDWYHQRVYDSDGGKLLYVLCLVIPHSSSGEESVYHAIVDQYALLLQGWVSERKRRWESWDRLFNERCRALRFEQGLYAELTPRERELVEELCRSMRLKLVASKLDISLNTARNHLKSVFNKLNVHSQEQLIRKALSVTVPQQ